jgi:ABC-2 type transport system permease protein
MIKLLRDTLLIFTQKMHIAIRRPSSIFFGLSQPLYYLFLFAPLLEKVLDAPVDGITNSLTIFTPGILIMAAINGTAFVGFGLISDIRAGVIERFRVTPINRVALLLGRSLRDVCIIFLQSTLLIIITCILGLSGRLLGILLSYGLIMLVSLTASCISYSAALIIQDEHILAPFTNLLLLSLRFLAGILLPLTFAPTWLQKIAFYNPVFHAVSGT